MGETENPIHIRLSGDRLDIKNHWMEKPVTVHFNLADHFTEDVEIMVMEKIHRDDVRY